MYKLANGCMLLSNHGQLGRGELVCLLERVPVLL
jgi:hypothetical protein